jgi:DNA-binding NtrC family response regulator
MNRLYNPKYKNIVIMDDEICLLWVFERMLENLPVNVFSFINAEEAMNCVRKLRGEVALFTTDYNHPYLSALKMAYMIKGAYPRIPFVVITAYYGKPQRLVKEGLADELFYKPFEKEQYIDLVERHCGLKNA